MSDREASGSRGGSIENGRDESPGKSSSMRVGNNKKDRISRSRSPRKMASRGSKYRSRSRSPRRRSRRSRSISGRRRSESHSPMSSRRRHTGNRENPKVSRCLGVFGLSVHTTEQELHHLFTKYGPVQRIQIVIDAKTGRSRGFGFCYFESVEDAKIAKEQCNQMEFDGRRLRVDYSITLRAHTPTPGIYMGKPTFVDRDRDRDRDRDYGRNWHGNRDRDDFYSGYGGHRSGGHRRSPPSPYHNRRRRYDRTRSRSYSPRRY